MFELKIFDRKVSLQFKGCFVYKEDKEFASKWKFPEFEAKYLKSFLKQKTN